MKTTLDNIENSEYLSELDELLAKAVQRGEALKMPKPKLHYKQKRQRARMRYERYKHRDWYVNYRKRFRASLKRKYSELKRKMLKRGIGFDLPYEDYVMAWVCCKPVNGGPAWLQTGRQKGRVKLERIDSSKPYSKDNIQITHGKEVLWP